MDGGSREVELTGLLPILALSPGWARRSHGWHCQDATSFVPPSVRLGIFVSGVGLLAQCTGVVVAFGGVASTIPWGAHPWGLSTPASSRRGLTRLVCDILAALTLVLPSACPSELAATTITAPQIPKTRPRRTPAHHPGQPPPLRERGWGRSRPPRVGASGGGSQASSSGCWSDDGEFRLRSLRLMGRCMMVSVWS